jgi:hypothetical protein
MTHGCGADDLIRVGRAHRDMPLRDHRILCRERENYAFSAASFSCIADGMNRRYAFSIIAMLVPVCAATVSGSTP